MERKLFSPITRDTFLGSQWVNNRRILGFEESTFIYEGKGCNCLKALCYLNCNQKNKTAVAEEYNLSASRKYITNFTGTYGIEQI